MINLEEERKKRAKHVIARHPDLLEQKHRIRKIVLKGGWHTLKELSRLTGDSETSISAQLRHMKKPKHGGYVLERKAVHDRSDGLYKYRIMPPGHVSAYTRPKRVNKFKHFLSELAKRDEMPDDIKEEIMNFVNDVNGVRNRYSDKLRRLNGIWGYELEE